MLCWYLPLTVRFFQKFPYDKDYNKQDNKPQKN